jgi:predicted PurR-regulated permease PerM
MSFAWSPRSRRALLVLAFVLSALAFGFWLREVFNPLLLALLLSYILNPIIELGEQRRVPRKVAVSALLLGALLTLGGLGTLFGVKLWRQADELKVSLLGEPWSEAPSLERSAPRRATLAGRHYLDLNADGARQRGLVERLEGRLRPTVEQLSEEHAESIGAALRHSAGRASDLVRAVAESAVRAGGSLGNLLSYVVLVPVYAFFFLLGFPDLKRQATLFVPTRMRAELIIVATEIDEAVAAFFRGRLILATGKGLATAIGLWLLDVPFGPGIGLLAGALSIIPAVGPLSGFILALLLGLANEAELGTLLLGLGAVFAVVEGLEALAFPFVLGRGVGLHPVSLILAFLVFGRLFGLFGVLLAVPIACILKILFCRYVAPELRAFASDAEDQAGGAEVHG